MDNFFFVSNKYNNYYQKKNGSIYVTQCPFYYPNVGTIDTWKYNITVTFTFTYTAQIQP